MNGLQDASLQTRRDSPTIITPPSESAFIHHDGRHLGSRKRKRGNDTMEDLLRECFVVKPSPSTVFVKPRTLQPIALLHRSDLPLAYLDLSPASNPLPESRLFESHVKILELERRMESTPVVLVARLDDQRSLFAVEYHSRGLYTICKLGKWVTLEELCINAVVSSCDANRSTSDGQRRDLSLDKVSARSLITPESSKYERKKRLAIEAIQSLVKRPTTGVSSLLLETPETSVLVNDIALPDTLASPGLPLEIPTTRHETPGPQTKPKAETNILENIRAQYLEMLYLSRASLAYFAKGPLSRARAAFHLDIDSNLNMADLIDLLETMTLTPNLLEKKYKETLPKLVSNLVPGTESANETVAAPGKKRSAKRKKVGKNGLYPEEDDLVRQWWEKHVQDGNSDFPGIASEEKYRQKISDLRIRETQLQMIVILEAIALQSRATGQAVSHEDLPPDTQEGNGLNQTIPVESRPKKRRDLSSLIDNHLDRLCIWQSLANDNEKAAPTEHNAHLSVSLYSRSNANDVLRDFCVEVIVPFFSARLPDLCTTISRKLGGVPLRSPARPALKKSSSTSSMLSRHAEHSKRSLPLKAKRTLQRVLTDERAGRNGSRNATRAISLMRSATDSVIPGLKREPSELSNLSDIQVIDSQSVLASRGGVQKTRRFSQREVDLSCLLTNTKTINKKTAIEEELKNAIAALKRPNRQLAAQTSVEMAEQRMQSSDRSRKSRKPIHNPLFQGVQILATPKARRGKDVMAELDSPSATTQVSTTIEAIPPSSLPRIPQSTVRPRLSRLVSNDSVPSVTIMSSSRREMSPDAVGATPSRPGNLPHDEQNLSIGTEQATCQHPPSSPLFSHSRSHSLTGKAAQRPIFEGHRKTDSQQSNSLRRTLVFDKPTILHDSSASLNSLPPEQGVDVVADMISDSAREPGDSIYKSLGWDDDDDFT